MDRKKIMQRLDRLEPRTWYTEDLSESYIAVYGFQGIEEVIRESGIEHIKDMLRNPDVSDDVKERLKEYFAHMAEESRM